MRPSDPIRQGLLVEFSLDPDLEETLGLQQNSKKSSKAEVSPFPILPESDKK
jgi:hypothetical protein